MIVCEKCFKKSFNNKIYCSNCGANLDKQITKGLIKEQKQKIQLEQDILNLLQQRLNKIERREGRKTRNKC